MGEVNTNHKTLVSGLQIKSGKQGRIIPGDHGEPQYAPHHIADGTLTGLATRNSDNKKVLVTCLHVMTGSVQTNPSGDEEMYQGSLSADRKVGSRIAWEPIRVGRENIADLALCELEDGVKAEFALHDDSDHTSAGRQIVAGVKEPEEGDELLMVGAYGGEKTVTVEAINQTDRVLGTYFTGLVFLKPKQHLIEPGDSGSTCLSKVRDDQYRMSCILFAGRASGVEGRAFPASRAESLLGITFGNRAPTANAGPHQTVKAGATVTLNGEGSSDPDGHTLTYSWLQMFGSGHEAQRPGAGVGLQ